MTADQDQGQDRGIAPTGYQALRGDLRERIRRAQVRAALSVNRTVITLYGEIGRAIRDRQEEHGRGPQVITRLSVGLWRVFPDLKGFSPRSSHDMRTFAGTYPDTGDHATAVARSPVSAHHPHPRPCARPHATGTRGRRSHGDGPPLHALCWRHTRMRRRRRAMGQYDVAALGHTGGRWVNMTLTHRDDDTTRMSRKRWENVR